MFTWKAGKVAWVVALALVYGLFILWYGGQRAPVTAAEGEAFLARMLANRQSDFASEHPEFPGNIRRLVARDDGREFFMLNVVRFAAEPVADPKTGVLRPAREMLSGYTKMFMPALFARGGHPAIAARVVGGYFDTWGMEPGPSWSLIGYMRYRSRRDLAMLASDPRFAGAHEFKFAAMPQTFNIPTQPRILALASPRLTVGLAITLIAAILQIAFLIA